MEKLTHLKTGLLASLLLPACVALGATPPAAPPASDAVMLTAWLHVEDYTMADVTVAVEVNGSSTEVGRVTENGRFTVSLPADADVVLRFEKPGHLPKEVVVDTHHAQEGEVGQKRRHVEFAVIMDLERHMAGLTYPGPVGTLSFDNGGGCLAVAHDRNRVPVKRHTPMVF